VVVILTDSFEKTTTVSKLLFVLFYLTELVSARAADVTGREQVGVDFASVGQHWN
jgi:hypothetical protein